MHKIKNASSQIGVNGKNIRAIIITATNKTITISNSFFISFLIAFTML